MKSFSKSELANYAGVSVRTLMRWLVPHMNKLEFMGLNPNAKLLPPDVVKYIVNKFDIDIPE